MTRIGGLSAVIASAVLLAACGSSGQSSAIMSGYSQALAFAKCMRGHGVTNFPDPTGGGGKFQVGGPGVIPQSPAFQTAQDSCQKLLPNGGPPTHMSASELRKAFAFAKCMRSHGEPNFPDPAQGVAPSNGEAVIALRGMFFKLSPGTGPQSPAFRQAARQCGIGLPNRPPSAALSAP